MNFYQMSRGNSRTSLRLLAIPLALMLLSGMLQPAFAAMQTAAQTQFIPDQQVDGTGNAVVRVLSYDEQSLTVEYVSGEVTSEPGLFAGEACRTPLLEGYGHSAPSGKPLLPVRGDLIGIPPGAQLSVRILEEQSIDLVDFGRVCPQQTSAYAMDLNNQPVLQERVQAWDAQVYAQTTWYPGQNLQAESAGMIRSQSVAQLSFSPLQYNPTTGDLRQVQRLVAHIEFNHPKIRQAASSGIVDEGYFEADLRNSLLNYVQAHSLRSTDAPMSSAGVRLGPSADSYRVLVNRTGLQQISYADLQTAGAPVDAWDAALIAMSDGIAPIAIEVSGAQDGSFDPGDTILFYGEALNNKYTDTNVYWLYEDNRPGLRWSSVDVTPGAAAVIPDSFKNTVHMEGNTTYQSSRPSGAENDHWYWDYLQATTSTVSKSFTTTLNHIATDVPDAKLRLLLHGYSASPEHQVRLLVNGNQVLLANWTAGAEYSTEVSFPHSYLLEGTNTITFEAPIGGGITSQTYLINWIEIDYYDTFVLESDRLDFSAADDQLYEHHLDGLSAPALDLLDASDPRTVRRLTGAQLSADPAPHQAVFTYAAPSAPNKLLALNLTQRITPLAIQKSTPSDLLSPANRVDYLLISHTNFLPQAQRLADFRSSQGFKTLVVDIQNVYDYFGSGKIDPSAITEFLKYAYANWTPPAPAFVVLFGDGHYDFRNYLQTSPTFYLPPYLGDLDPYMGETAADNRFVTIVGGDILPDLYLGRLPAQTMADATAMVDKIISYEQKLPWPVDWYRKTTFVTDNPDSAGNFYALSDNIVDNYLPLEYQREKIYYKQTHADASAVRTAILSAVNQGRLLVGYIGHASVQWWAFEKLFSKDDIPALTNLDRLTFFTPMTCMEGYYINPSLAAQSLSELLERSAVGGSIASWAPTGLGVATGHDYLQRGLFIALFDDQVTRLGPATNQAKLFLYSNSITFNDLVDTYVLLGDPATRLNTIAEVSSRTVFLPILRK